jgi:hypothetical protein
MKQIHGERILIEDFRDFDSDYLQKSLKVACKKYGPRVLRYRLSNN